MSSKRHTRRSKCERKIKYFSAGAARAASRRFVAMGGDLLHEYPCELGGGNHWHLGHTPNRVEFAIAAKMGAHKARRKIRKATA
jgi:hypothetical protein